MPIYYANQTQALFTYFVPRFTESSKDVNMAHFIKCCSSKIILFDVLLQVFFNFVSGANKTTKLKRNKLLLDRVAQLAVAIK